MPDARADVIVIGTGVVGLACARALADRARVLVIERHPRPGCEGSARNSGVIHVGVHHPASWKKGELCVRGRALLLEHCARAGVPHRLPGKLIVASGAEDRDALARIAARARESGVEHRPLDRDAARALEPGVACDEALLVPGTGVVATRALVDSLEADAIARGASIAYGHEVRGLAHAGEWIVECAGFRARAASIVVAAGLASDRLASLAGIDVAALGGPHRFCAGRWMSLDRRLDGAVSRLVYPVPSPGGLGIHLTVDLDGSLRAGPDTLWIDAPDAPVPPPTPGSSPPRSRATCPASRRPISRPPIAASGRSSTGPAIHRPTSRSGRRAGSARPARSCSWEWSPPGSRPVSPSAKRSRRSTRPDAKPPDDARDDVVARDARAACARAARRAAGL